MLVLKELFHKETQAQKHLLCNYTYYDLLIQETYNKDLFVYV